MKEIPEVEDLIAKTAQARRNYLATGTSVAWLIYQDLYLALGRRAFCPRQGVICQRAMQAMNRFVVLVD
ncbi:hypothetical protein FKD06_19420 [Serratia sp. SRS-8-S-2018]|uniref:hypothetical protein n=1 Tax=Serratia sp. SRS-8-S-2018 TaxID=2591107 RepID=UPI0011401F45|nr:hypothetical protein [Serratia sp. SRS-8-S-2018]TPW45431.1 hypothetical protein FKD06_19420 [Serratia sp. SRS-8-S-2018]